MSRTELKFVSVNTINIDHSYQRTLDVKRIDRLKRAYNRGACKAVSLSRRDDGSLWVYDGQHTLALAIASGEDAVPAVIVSGDQQKEAKWFLLMNGSGVSKANVRDRHRASVAMGDDIAAGVESLLSRHGVCIAKGGTKAGATTAIGSIQGWYRDDPVRIERVFSAIKSMWEKEDGAWTQIVMRGMWDVASDADHLEQVRLGLIRHKVTPRRVLDTAAGMQAATGVPGGGSGYAATAIRQLSKTVRK